MLLKRLLSRIALVLLILLPVSLYSQGIKGSVVDHEGQPVPYASIFIKELTRGTTTNANGIFSLPLPTGTYHIYFRSLGYTEVQKIVRIEEAMEELLITLPPQTYMIPEIRVVASGEDPAYAVMRKAIGLSAYHLNVIKSYDAEIYIKGTAIFTNIPRALAKRIELNDVRLQENKVYMLESLNEVKFTAPDKYDMRVLASQNTIPGYTESVNPMNYINASLYEPEVEKIISPLSRSAFFHYNFTFEGSYLEGMHMIDKIKVTPKRKSQQVWEGTLYIVEDLWCIHSCDLSVETIAGTINLRQLYANVLMDAWLPVNHKIVAGIDVVGVKASVTYVSSLKYADVELNANLPKSFFDVRTSTTPATGGTTEATPTKEEEQISELLAKDDLNNREMARLTKLMEKQADEANGAGASLEVVGTQFVVEQNAVKNDSAYWNDLRPVPLTPAELTTLQTRDSIAGIKQQNKSITGNNTLTVGIGAGKKPPSGKTQLKGILLGKTYRNKNKMASFNWGGVINPAYLGFNTVDGWNYRQELRIHWKMDTVRVFRSHLMAGYGFNRKAPMITWNNNLLYAPMRRGKVALNLKYSSQDFNGLTGIPSSTNMLYSLFLRQNPINFYELLNINFENRLDIANGLVLDFYTDLSQRNPLSNTNEFSFFFRNKDFNPNLPAGMTADDPALQQSMLLGVNVFLEFTPGYYYEIRNNRKEMLETNNPTFILNYRNGIPLGSSWADFHMLSLGVKHRAETGLLSHIDWSAEFGYFLSARNMHFSDYKQFKSVSLPVDMQDFDNAFFLLDPYRAATNSRYFEGHFRFETAYLAFKFLPFLSDKVWTEALSLSYLYTPEIPHHVELGYTMNNLFLYMVDFGVFAAFEDWDFVAPGIRFNLHF